MTKLAAVYIRVSTEEQTEYSPDAQLAEIRKYAAREGYAIPPEFVFSDEGITGRKTAKRDGFNRMIGVAKTKPRPFDAILLWKFSRFARNREDSVVYKSMLRKQLGIDVVSVSEPVGDDKMSVLIEALIEAMDEYYSINLAEEVRRGMTEKARRGGLQTTPPFGYGVSGNVLVALEGEAAVVRDIFGRFARGDGLSAIARSMNNLGIRTRRGNAFESRAVEYILRNPVYIGKLRWNPVGRTRRDFASKDAITADAAHEPLIGDDIWCAAQSRLDALKAWNARGMRAASSPRDWVSGLVRCAECGAAMVLVKPHYLRCNGYAKGACATSQHADARVIKEAIIRRLESDMSATAELEVTAANSVGVERERAVSAAIAAAERRLARARDAYLAGIDALEVYAGIKARIEREIAELRTRHERADDVSARCATLAELLRSDASMTEKHAAVRDVISLCAWNKARAELRVVYVS
jgi:DNA invertase Pin-like site-specific DNA recombinase